MQYGTHCPSQLAALLHIPAIFTRSQKILGESARQQQHRNLDNRPNQNINS